MYIIIKGIPLAVAVSMAWYQLYQEAKDFTYNRKEVKDHGEGGSVSRCQYER